MSVALIQRVCGEMWQLRYSYKSLYIAVLAVCGTVALFPGYIPNIFTNVCELELIYITIYRGPSRMRQCVNKCHSATT